MRMVFGGICIIIRNPAVRIFVREICYDSSAVCYRIGRRGGGGMCYYIGIEDLVANALIELMKKEERKVSFQTLSEYGAKVVKQLEESGEEAMLVLSRDRTNHFLIDYSDLVYVVEDNYIALKEDKSINDLVDRFGMAMAFKVLEAFRSEAVKEVLAA